MLTVALLPNVRAGLVIYLFTSLRSTQSKKLKVKRLSDSNICRVILVLISKSDFCGARKLACILKAPRALATT